MRLIVVEDDPFLRRALSEILRRDGMQVLAQTANGAEALVALEQLHQERVEPDIILTDCDMPRVNGIEFVQRLRAAGDQTPVVMLSGKSAPTALAQAAAAGVTRYLVKPVSAEFLTLVLRQTCHAAAA